MLRTTIGGITISITDGVVDWCAGLAVESDGAPFAYAPEGSGLTALDYLANAGKPGRWFGVVTDTGHGDGNPIVQGPHDPAPGYYISPTSLCDKSLKISDPRRYVSAMEIPYLSIPPEMLLYLKMGDVAFVRNLNNQRTSAAIFADVGPHDKLGEGSIALALSLGINANPKKGGVESGIAVTAFRRSSRGWPRALTDINLQVESLRLSA